MLNFHSSNEIFIFVIEKGRSSPQFRYPHSERNLKPGSLSSAAGASSYHLQLRPVLDEIGMGWAILGEPDLNCSRIIAALAKSENGRSGALRFF